MKKITLTLVFLSILTFVSCKKKEEMAPLPTSPPPTEIIAPPPPSPPPIAPEKETLIKK
jgi:hypothetical protein